MGLPSLWDALGDGQVITLPDLARDHYLRTQQPLRIAVDEAHWRFNNVTAQQTEQIRQSEPAANPVEKAIFWRLVRLMRLNIQPMFVFDGPSRPWKRGRNAGRIDYNLTKLLERLLDVLQIPRHRAPAEAEAECARLQQAGIVDAVYSEDADTLMFGCTFLIRNYREDGKKVADKVRVYKPENLLALGKEELVLFAMLNGGDYDTKGLVGCGPKLALECVRAGLGTALYVSTKHDMMRWSDGLRRYLQSRGSAVQVPINFPDYKTLVKYRGPKVSSTEQLNDLRGLRKGWDMPINEVKLRQFLQLRFNIWTRGARRKNDSEDPSGLKLWFQPTKYTTLDMSSQPPEEDWSVFTDKNGNPYDPKQEIECEILQCLVERAISKADLDAKAVRMPKDSGKSASNKTKYQDEDFITRKRKRKNGEISNTETPAKAAKTITQQQRMTKSIPTAVDLTLESEDGGSDIESTSGMLVDDLFPPLSKLLASMAPAITSKLITRQSCGSLDQNIASHRLFGSDDRSDGSKISPADTAMANAASAKYLRKLTGLPTHAYREVPQNKKARTVAPTPQQNMQASSTSKRGIEMIDLTED